MQVRSFAESQTLLARGLSLTSQNESHWLELEVFGWRSRGLGIRRGHGEGVAYCFQFCPNIVQSTDPDELNRVMELLHVLPLQLL